MRPLFLDFLPLLEQPETLLDLLLAKKGECAQNVQSDYEPKLERDWSNKGAIWNFVTSAVPT